MRPISKDFAFLYDYEIDDHGEEIDIKFNFPQIFNPNVFKISLDKEKSTILITIPDQLPLVAGKLYGNVNGYTTTKDAKSYTISFEKANPAPWESFITDPIPGTDEIDPKSALLIFQKLSSIEKETQEQHDTAQKMLSFSLESHFLPALVIGIEYNSHEFGDKDTLIDLLSVACLKYEFPPALFQLGIILLNNEQTAVNGFNFLQKAAEKGIGLAVIPMASALSPLSKIKFPAKDAEQALLLFEEVIKHAEEPNALYEAAKLYDAGLGCKVNREKALEYLNRAKKIDPMTPDLPKRNNAIKTFAIVATSCAAAAGLGYAVYKIFKNKK